MTLFVFCLGLIAGIGLKIFFDYYHVFIIEQQKIKSDMEEVLFRFKKIEEEKKLYV